jgi:predicted permease
MLSVCHRAEKFPPVREHLAGNLRIMMAGRRPAPLGFKAGVGQVCDLPFREKIMKLFLERLWQDLYHGCRMLTKNPGFTLVAVISLAIGIGANCAMYSWADALLLRPLPVARPGEVLSVGTKVTLAGFTSLVNSYPDFRDLRDHNRSFGDLTAFNSLTVGFTTKPDALPQMKYGVLVTSNLFKAMGVEPELGRGFRPEEDQVPGRDAVVVLDHALWEQQFAADRSILGRKVRMNGIEFTVIGVTPDRFTGLNQLIRPAFYAPLMMYPRLSANPKALESRASRELSIKCRLKPGVSMTQAQAELTTFARNLERAYPDTNKNQDMVVRTELQSRIDQDPVDASLSAMLLMLSAAVLLVACINVAGLLTSRAPARAKEMALRLAIGAGRARLIRQLITESLLVALAGGVLGIGVGYLGVMVFQQIQIPTDLPITLDIQLNPRVLFFSLAVALFSVLLFGLIPALQTTRVDLASAMKTGDAAQSGRRRVWGRSFLVGCQVAVSLVLLTVSAFMYRGFHRQLADNQGFRKDHLMMMSFDPSLVHYNEAQTQQFYKQLVERSRSVPGVRAVALTSSIPMSTEGDAAAIVPEGYQFPAGKDNVIVFGSRVDENFFETMGVSLVRGRGFSETDTADTPHVAVVNEELAQHYWPGQDALGKRFRVLDASKPNSPWVEIVGIAKTGKYLWIAEPPTEFLYLPYQQNQKSRMVLISESAGASASVAAPLREAVRGLDANQPIFDVRTMEEFYDMRVVSTGNTIMEIVAGMGVMGLILATIGLYGLGAYAVSRRTREIGIRMAIGASRPAVLQMALRQGLTPALYGVAAGLVASVFAERLLKAVFPTHTRTDITAYLLVVPALLAVTMLAAYLPARRASRVDPIKALRYE